MRTLIASLLALMPLTALAADFDDALLRGLSLRGSDAPGCEQLLALGPADSVRDAMVRIADDVPRPPWVPMRAASCVASLSATDTVAFDAAKRWVSQPETPGFALVVLQRAEALPVEQALVLGRLALEHTPPAGAQKQRIAARLAASPYSDVRGLAADIDQ